MIDQHDFIGHVQLDGSLRLDFFTTNGSSVVTAPSAAPTFKIYGPDGLVESGTSSVLDSGVTGSYRITISPTAAKGYEPGTQYTVMVNYTASVAKGSSFSFLVT